MAFLQSGGSLVTSSNIVDGSIVNADVAAAAGIAQSKLGIGANGNTDLFAVETSSGTTHSLTTVANQRVLVFVMGVTTHVAARTITVLYNGVAKNQITTGLAGGNVPNPFALFYTEVPGAATANITVTDSAGTLSDVDIFVLKLKST